MTGPSIDSFLNLNKPGLFVAILLTNEFKVKQAECLCLFAVYLKNKTLN